MCRFLSQLFSESARQIAISDNAWESFIFSISFEMRLDATVFGFISSSRASGKHRWSIALFILFDANAEQFRFSIWFDVF